MDGQKLEWNIIFDRRGYEAIYFSGSILKTYFRTGYYENFILTFSGLFLLIFVCIFMYLNKIFYWISGPVVIFFVFNLYFFLKYFYEFRSWVHRVKDVSSQMSENYSKSRIVIHKGIFSLESLVHDDYKFTSALTSLSLIERKKGYVDVVFKNGNRFFFPASCFSSREDYYNLVEQLESAMHEGTNEEEVNIKDE